MDNPRTRTEIIELFQLHASVPTNQRTFRTRNRHEKSACRCRLKFVIPTPSNRNCWRAPPERGRNTAEERPPGCFSSARKGGGVEQDRTCTRAVPEILHWRTRPNFLAKFFGKKFWK